VAAGLFYSASIRPRQPLESRDGSLAEVAKPAAAIATPPATQVPFLIRLTGGKDIRWSYADIPVEIGSDLPTGELELVRGVAEVTFGGGAQVSLKAPAQLTVTSAGSARLHRGRVSAHVPPQAIGFRIQTPTTDVVDLGTDFSVEVNQANETQIWVHNGLVELQSRFKLAGESEPRRQRLRGGEYHRVASLTGGTPVAVSPSRADQFVRRVSVRRDPMLIEQGGTFAPGNLALLPTAQPFATRCLDHVGHSIAGLCDGHYGNSSSWIAEAGEPMFAGVRFGGKQTISSIAFGRDNGNDLPDERTESFIDRCAGSYTLQITTAETPDVTTPDSDWITLGTITQGGEELDIASGRYKPYLRHRYAFAPVEATGVRILVSDSAIAIDELEVYGVDENNSYREP
jgi:hypothetical protein